MDQGCFAMPTSKRTRLLPLAFMVWSGVWALLFSPVTVARVYQFGIEVPKPADNPLIWNHTLAFLWIPPSLKHIRAVLLAPANIIEKRFCDSRIIRREAARDGLAVMFFDPGWKSGLVHTPQVVPYIQNLLNKLALKSGYGDLATAPWIPIGHSGNSFFVTGILRYAPQRTVAAIYINGGLINPAKNGTTVGIGGIPIMFFTGQFEEVPPPGHVRDAWWGVQMHRFYTDKQAVPHCLISGMLDRGYGHLNWFAFQSRYAALFLHEAIQARLPSPATRSDKLNTIHYADGWLCDPTGWFSTRTPRHKSAPVEKYKGNPARAYWVFDKTMAAAWQHLFFHDAGHRQQMIAFVQHGKIAPLWHGWGVQQITFDPMADGITFRVHAVFRKQIPRIYTDGGTKLGHAKRPPIQYCVLGWAGQTQQVGPQTFRIAFNREGINGRTLHVIIGAYQTGSAHYLPAIGSASFYIPLNHSGVAPKITFPPIANVVAGSHGITLRATVNSPLPVRYYVSWGPAKIMGNKLVFTPIPLHSRFPVQVRVTAYQWGKVTKPQYAAARSVTRVFYIYK